MSKSNPITLSGILSFQTVNEKKVPFLKAIEESVLDEVVVSMASVTKADSAGLALMIEGVRFAQKKNKQLAYSDVPKHLLSLAKFCQLDFVIQSNAPVLESETQEIC